MNADPAQARRNRGRLLLLAALFFLPLLVSFVLYYGLGWRPAGAVQNGDLIDPARPLREVSLARVDGQLTDAGFLRGKWSLVYIGAGTCDARCRQALVDTRQIRLALDQKAPRVQRVFLYSGQCCEHGLLESEHPDLQAARVDNAPGDELLRAFPSYDGVPVAQAGRIYIVDPLGNLMMSYAPNAERKGILKDLQRLLKLSHIG
jgi:cytochrome oxidase Cu insertion factor (SCO1/SenC/PrrC family)